jgi:hypothetical protein
MTFDAKDDRVAFLDSERLSDRLGNRDLTLGGDPGCSVHELPPYF